MFSQSRYEKHGFIRFKNDQKRDIYRRMRNEHRIQSMGRRADALRSLTIDGDWVLRRQCNGVLVCVTDSSTAALMTETDQREKCNQENNVCG